MFKRLALLSAVFALTTLAGTAAQETANSYPSKPVTIIVPYSAGGGNDLMARILADKLGEKFGQRFLVENRPGAGSAVGTAYVAAQPADGYTLLFSTNQLIATNLTLKEPNYKIEDFVPIALMSASPEVLTVNAQLPVNNVEELVAYAKAHPGELTYGTVGTASTDQVISARFNRAAGTDMTEVPFGGGSDVMTALVGGEVQVYFGSNVQEAVSGDPNLRFLAVAGDRRSSFVPDLPTLQELGYPISSSSWSAMFARSAIPADILEKLRDAVHEIVVSDDIKVALNKMSREPYLGTVADFQASMDGWRNAIDEHIAEFNIVPQ